jgi:hypothetical protein
MLGTTTRGQRIEIKLASGAAMWLRVLPSVDPGKSWKVPQLLEVATVPTTALPLNECASAYGTLRREDGCGVYSRASDSADLGTATAVLYIFTTGEIWKIDTEYIRMNPNYIVLREEYFKTALSRCASLLESLGIPPPYRWIAGIEGVQGRFLAAPGVSMPERGFGPCAISVISSSGVYSPTTGVADAMRPFFEHVFESFAADRPSSLG